MSKIIVVSDSHGLVEPLERIYNHYKDEVDAFIHCGDSELPQCHPIFDVYQAVKGNCDDDPFPLVRKINVNNYTILFTHGHKHNVHFDLDKLYYFGLENEANLVCFGHTHRPTIEQLSKDMVLLNPGSLHHNRVFERIPTCFALVELNDIPQIKFINQSDFSVMDIIK